MSDPTVCERGDPGTPLEDADARTLRGHWFRYLDTLEPLRPELFAYCRKLTGSAFEAEDLVQDTLLKGFGMTARGDFHGPDSPVRNPRAYLFRTATNLWLDDRRRQQRLTSEHVETGAGDPDTVAMAESIAHARAHTSAAEFASLLLKDLYAFTLDDIADFIGTTPGTVKSALSRARSKTREDRSTTPAPSPEERTLAAAFAEAINAGDEEQVLELMAETLQIVVCNVGGGRGKSGIWTSATVAAAPRASVADLDGRCVVVLVRDGALYDVLRLNGSEGRLTRLTDYCYAPEVLREAAAALDLTCTASAYHQAANVLPRMIGTTTLPWRQPP